MAINSTGRRVLVNKGIYDSTLQYYPMDAVYYEKSYYICIKACVGINPTDTNYWGYSHSLGDIGISLGIRLSDGILYITDTITTKDLGKVSILYRGEYSSTATYASLDVVTYDGSSYICIKDTTGNLPTDPTYFGLLCEGTEGRGITSVTLIENKHLVVNYTDGTSNDIGEIIIKTPLDQIDAVSINSEGHLILSKDDGTTLDAGYAVGPKGDTGVGLESAYVNEYGDLILTYTTGVSKNVGTVGFGASIVASNVSADGHLQFTMSTGATIDAGYVLGPTGAPGPKGEKGDPGIQGVKGDTGTSVTSVTKISGTGQSGSTDVYQINLDDGTSSTFTVYNGRDGEGSGDMTKEVYDTNNDGVVDDSEKLAGHLPEYFAPSDHTHSVATTSANGFMSSTDKSKLDGIAEGANKYVHPLYKDSPEIGFYKIVLENGHVSEFQTVVKKDITDLGIPESDTTYDVASGTSDGLLSSADKSKLDGIAANANNYTHPTYTTQGTLGLYKIATTNGHVSSIVAATKEDITGLGALAYAQYENGYFQTGASNTSAWLTYSIIGTQKCQLDLAKDGTLLVNQKTVLVKGSAVPYTSYSQTLSMDSWIDDNAYTLMLRNNGTDTSSIALWKGGALTVNGSIVATEGRDNTFSGTLTVSNTNSAGGYVKIWEDGEGGNIAIRSGSGKEFQIDSYDNNSLRCYSYTDEGNIVGVSFNRITGNLYTDGNFYQAGQRVADIQHGSLNVGTSDTTITFPHAFAGVPSVCANGSKQTSIRVYDITATGCTLVSGESDNTVNWIAAY